MRLEGKVALITVVGRRPVMALKVAIGDFWAGHLGRRSTGGRANA